MTSHYRKRVALLYPGDRLVRENATPGNKRLTLIFQSLTDLGVHAEPAVYHDAFCEEVRQQPLKRILEQEWVPALQRKLDLDTARLPIWWDCDFLLGPKNDRGEDTYVLCEINASSIAPFPESAAPYVARATLDAVR